MANYLVVIPPYKPAYVTKAKNADDILNIIYNKVSLKPRATYCRINKTDYRLIIAKNQTRMAINEKAMSIADEIVKGYGIITKININGDFLGMPEKVARLIADRINERNREAIVEDVGA